jgi:hypothetical protein
MEEYIDPIALFIMLNAGHLALYGATSAVCDHECWHKVFNTIAPDSGESPIGGWDKYLTDGNCEAKAITDRDAFIYEPFNAWSSFSANFVGNGVIATSLYVANHHEDYMASWHSNQMLKHPIWIFLLGSILNLAGVGSFIYHASNTRFGEVLDHTMVSPFFGFLAIYNIMDLLLEFMNEYEHGLGDKLSPYIAWTAFTFVIGFSFYTQYNELIPSPLLFLIYWVIQMVTIFLKKGLDNRLYHIGAKVYPLSLLVATASLLIGAVLLGVYFPLPCWPNSILKFHSYWHLACAVSSSFYFNFYFYAR